MVAKQKSGDDEAQNHGRSGIAPVTALRPEARALPESLHRYLADGVTADEIEELLDFIPGSIDALGVWVERFIDRPEVTAVEFRIDRSSASPAVVPTTYTTIADDMYIDYLMNETTWWLETFGYPLDIIRPAIW